MLTNLDFLEPGQPWPPISEQPRIDLYIENEHLRNGNFETVWPDLKDYLRKGKTSKDFEFTLDYPSLITTKTSDLIIGEPPEFCLPSETGQNPQEKAIDDLIDRCGFLEVLDALITNVDSLGDGVLKLSQAADKSVKILNINPSQWFPVVKRGTDEVLYHVLGFKYQDADISYLEIEIHGKNDQGAHVIEHRLYRLNESQVVNSTASTIGERLQWANPEVSEIEENPLGDFLIISCSQKSDGIYGKSSYSHSLKNVLKKLIIRYALENDVLDTFSRPTFFGPSEYTDLDPITKKPVFRPGGYIALNPDPHTTPILPAGLVWDAHLTENQVAIQSLMDRLFDVSEMSPVLFASSNGRMGTANSAESGTALRLRLTNTLAKCNRIRRKVDGAARKALNAALSLEGTPLDGLYIEWGSNLPRLPLEEAQRFQLLAMTPQFAGETGGQFLLRELGYSEEEAKDIMMDASRNGGAGGMI